MAGILFCRECNNMLYPKEDRQQRRLLYACRTCTYSEPSPPELHNCIYVNDLKAAPTARLTISKELILDPTLRRTKAVTCPKCGHREAVFFNSGDNRLDLVFVCCNPECTHWWAERTT